MLLARCLVAPRLRRCCARIHTSTPRKFDQRSPSWIASEDLQLIGVLAQIIEGFAHLREAGFTRARGYSGAELTVIDDAMETLVENEFQASAGRLANETPEELRDMAQRVNPFLEHMMVVMRRKKIRQLSRRDVADRNR